jgi:hypothetical protein
MGPHDRLFALTELGDFPRGRKTVGEKHWFSIVTFNQSSTHSYTPLLRDKIMLINAFQETK